MAQYGQMVDVMSDSHTFDRQHAVRPIMHPARVVRFHLQGVDERLFIAIRNQVVRETFVAVLNNHGHDIGGIA